MIQWDWLIKWEAPIRHVWLCQSYRLQTKWDNRRQTHFNWGIKTLWNSLCPHAPTMPRQIGCWNDNKVIVVYTERSRSAAAVVTGSAHQGGSSTRGFASDLILQRIIGTVTAWNTLFTPSVQSHMPSSLPLPSLVQTQCRLTAPHSVHVLHISLMEYRSWIQAKQRETRTEIHSLHLSNKRAY